MKSVASSVNKLITRTQHNDFSRIVYRVADFTRPYTTEKTQCFRAWGESEALYYEERGCIIDTVKKSNNPILPYKVTMIEQIACTTIEFSSYEKAANYARENFDRLWTAYQNSQS